MPQARPSDTRARILAVALDLFITKGVRQTSLREIADRLAITKPALYYHFTSREELVRSVVQPLIEEVEAFLVRAEAAEQAGPVSARELLGSYFDLLYRHSRLTLLIVREPTLLEHLDLPDRMVQWRGRLGALLLGPDPSLADQARAVVAIGGLSDCTVLFAHVPSDELRPAALDAACSALGPLIR